MSDADKIRTLRAALERIADLAEIPDGVRWPFCVMVTRREDCRTHRTEWGAIHAEAVRALRDTE